MSGVVARNLDALLAERHARDGRRTPSERAVDAVTRFAGSLPFVYLHAGVLVFWLLANTGRLGVRPWDPYPFVMLAMAASVEAIFISTFVLIGQSRAAVAADRRADLDLQINLLAEHEVTRLIAMVEAIAQRLDAPIDVPDLAEIKKDVAPEVVVRQIEAQQGRSA